MKDTRRAACCRLLPRLCFAAPWRLLRGASCRATRRRRLILYAYYIFIIIITR